MNNDEEVQNFLFLIYVELNYKRGINFKKIVWTKNILNKDKKEIPHAYRFLGFRRFLGILTENNRVIQIIKKNPQ